ADVTLEAETPDVNAAEYTFHGWNFRDTGHSRARISPEPSPSTAGRVTGGKLITGSASVLGSRRLHSRWMATARLFGQRSEFLGSGGLMGKAYAFYALD